MHKMATYKLRPSVIYSLHCKVIYTSPCTAISTLYYIVIYSLQYLVIYTPVWPTPDNAPWSTPCTWHWFIPYNAQWHPSCDTVICSLHCMVIYTLPFTVLYHDSDIFWTVIHITPLYIVWCRDLVPTWHSGQYSTFHSALLFALCNDPHPHLLVLPLKLPGNVGAHMDILYY